MRKKNSPGCRCCKPACKAYAVVVRSTTPAGLAVTLSGTLDGEPWSVEGVTDDAGAFAYTLPETAPFPVVKSATVKAPDFAPSPGCSATANFDKACSLVFTYCRTAVRAKFSAEVNPTLTASQPANLTIPWSVTRDDAAGVIVWDVCCLKPGVSPPGSQNPLCPSYNTNVEFRATDPAFHTINRTGRPPRCAGVLVNCGVVVDVDLRQEPYPDCYNLGACGPVQCRDTIGPPYVGATPRKLQVRFKTTAFRSYFTPWGTGPFEGGPLFAGDEGAWIDVIEGDSGLRSGAGNYLAIQWASYNDQIAGDPVLNSPCRPVPPIPPGPRAGCRELTFPATRVTIDSNGNNGISVVYRRTNTAYDPTKKDGYDDVTGEYHLPRETQTIANVPAAAFCVPIPTTAYQFSDAINGGSFTLEIRDGCGGSYDGNTQDDQPGTYDGNTQDPQARMMMASFAAPAAALAPSSKLRVGLLSPCFLVGGAEEWQLSLVDALQGLLGDLVEFTGAAVLGQSNPAMLAELAGSMPVGQGLAAARDLASRVDVLVSWAVVDYAALFAGLSPAPRSVFVCHLPSAWGSGSAAMLAPVDAFVAVSSLAQSPIPLPLSLKSTVIWNAVAPSRFGPTRTRAAMRAAWGVSSTAYVVGYVGRLSAEKDPDAAARLAAACPEVTVVVVGDGPLRSSLAASAASLPNLKVVGADTGQGAVYGALDAVLVPSQFESFGLTIAEAAWLGVPAITTPTGLATIRPGISRTIPVGATGAQLAAAVRADRADVVGTAKRVADAKTWARATLTLDRMARQYANLFASLSPAALASKILALLNPVLAPLLSPPTAMASSGPPATPEAICRSCDQLEPGLNYCRSRCTCPGAAWQYPSCPLGKW